MIIQLAEEQRTKSIIGDFFDVYNNLGFGFVEPVYANALQLELTERGHRVEREVRVRVFYKGRPVAWHRIDMLVDGKVIVENKATELLHAYASRQLDSYLKATKLEVGLLLHFGPAPRFFRHYWSNDRKLHGSDQSDVSVQSEKQSVDAGVTPVPGPAR